MGPYPWCGVPPVPNRITPVKMLWHCEFYDFAHSGMIKYDNRRYWFQLQSDGRTIPFDPEDPRPDVVMIPNEITYHVFNLTPEQLVNEEQKHEEFKKHVGEHTTYINGRRTPGKGLKSRSEWKKFYDQEFPELKLQTSQMFGWFAYNDVERES